MTHDEAHKLIETIKSFVADPLGVQAIGNAAAQGRKVLAQAVDGSSLVKNMSDPIGVTKVGIIGHKAGTGTQTVTMTDSVKLFEQFKKWLLDDLREDPVFVQLLAQRPELVVEFTPRRVTLQGDTLKGRIARLMASGWLGVTRTTGAVRTELKRTGTEPNGGNLSTALGEFVRDGFLTRDGDGFILAPDVKITEKELVSE